MTETRGGVRPAAPGTGGWDAQEGWRGSCRRRTETGCGSGTAEREGSDKSTVKAETWAGSGLARRRTRAQTGFDGAASRLP